MSSPSMEMQSTEISSLLEALAKAQSTMSDAVKDSANPFFKSRYADLTSVWEACRDPLTKNGLSVIQITQIVNGATCLVSILGHLSGQWIKSILPIKPAKDDIQSLGSAITYTRRYALSALVGVCPSDDDGEAAMDRNKKKEKEKVEIEPTITLNLPADIDVSQLEIFIQESAKNGNCSVNAVKKRAAGNMEGFLKVFKKWQLQFFSQTEHVDKEEIETA